MKKELSIFVKAILAGICIAVGGVIFLACESKVMGSCLFSIGLFCVCTFGLNLYTGKVCYVFSNDWKYGLNTITIWFGNLVGCFLVGAVLHLTRIASMGATMAAMVEKANSMVDLKFNDSLLSIFILGIFCNMMIYVGVESYLRNPHEFGKYLGIVLCIMVFILCGFEHCVANMFYITMAGRWSGYAWLFLLVNTAGNAIGGWVFPVLRKLAEKLEK